MEAAIARAGGFPRPRPTRAHQRAHRRTGHRKNLCHAHRGSAVARDGTQGADVRAHGPRGAEARGDCHRGASHVPARAVQHHPQAAGDEEGAQQVRQRRGRRRRQRPDVFALLQGRLREEQELTARRGRRGRRRIVHARPAPVRRAPRRHQARRADCLCRRRRPAAERGARFRPRRRPRVRRRPGRATARRVQAGGAERDRPICARHQRRVSPRRAHQAIRPGCRGHRRNQR
mmetsp:Transcript_2718/g.11644  ORF Transcript_2718/g.11644 Transcript_2718/m.11644 type:complete len:232 (-) Transcript_2718:2530-3225(-)